jgi:LmbE family N-acetylglucosaminyl deacetylase
MHRLSLDADGPLRVLCLGAHSDDIEIGCGGTLMRWLCERRAVEVQWAVFCGGGERGAEARRSADALLDGAASRDIALGGFGDALLPTQLEAVKGFARELHGRFRPDVVFTHRLEDRHQDHRCVAEVTWQTWRDHLILEYEIPKYEGDLGQPNVYLPLATTVRDTKLAHLMTYFGSQRGKDWFTPETFDALLRLRGVECRAPDGHAEAFHARKLVL